MSFFLVKTFLHISARILRIAIFCKGCWISLESLQLLLPIDCFLVALMQIFEWWYFRKYGTSFIEHVSLSHLGPLLGSSDNTATNPQQNVAGLYCLFYLEFFFSVCFVFSYYGGLSLRTAVILLQIIAYCTQQLEILVTACKDSRIVCVNTNSPVIIICCFLFSKCGMNLMS